MWIDAVASSFASGLIAFASGRDLRLISTGEPGFGRLFTHENVVSGISFDPKGPGSPSPMAARPRGTRASPSRSRPFSNGCQPHGYPLVAGRFLVSAMQDAQLHGWRLPEGKDMRMGGYPSKIRSMAFMSNGLILATAGAPGVVAWPFAGPGGPMGKEAIELAYEEHSLVAQVAAAGLSILAGGREDGRVFALDLRSGGRLEPVRAEKGPPISASRSAPMAVWPGAMSGGARGHRPASQFLI